MMQVQQQVQQHPPQQGTDAVAFALPDIAELTDDAFGDLFHVDVEMDLEHHLQMYGTGAAFADDGFDLAAWDGAGPVDPTIVQQYNAVKAKVSPPPLANSPFSGVLIPQGAGAGTPGPTHFGTPPTPPTSPSDAGSIDGDSSGNESGGGGDTTAAKKTAGARRAPTRRAACGGQQQPPRKKWKCSKEFLLASIEDRERTQLTAKGISVPARGACPTSVPKAQEAELRKALRRIRNVESAKRSRAHQKTHQIELEKTVAAVHDTNATLARENAALKQENQTLLQQLAQFRKQLGGDGAALFMVILCCGISCALNTFLTAAASSPAIAGGVKFRSRTLLMVEDEPAAAFFGSLGLGAAGLPAALACLVAAAAALATAVLAVHAVRRALKLPALGDFSSDSSLSAAVFGQPTRTASGKAAF